MVPTQNSPNSDISPLNENDIPDEIDKSKIFSKVSEITQIAVDRTAKAIELIESGNTVPFIARYRKEITGNMDEEVLRTVKKTYSQITQLEERKIFVLHAIQKQQKLTTEIKDQIIEADNLQTVEDIYLPFKPKIKTLATKAREKGLQPLADAIKTGKISIPLDKSADEFIAQFVNPEKGVSTLQEAIDGSIDIIAEETSTIPEIRQFVRSEIEKKNTVSASIRDEVLQGKMEIKNENGKIIDYHIFENYFDFSAAGSHLQNHQILALNRAENLDVISLNIETSDENLIHEIQKQIIGSQTEKSNPFLPYYLKGIEKGYKRYMIRSLKREYWKKLTERAEIHAINVFATNLRNLLMTPPLKNRSIIGIDPGYRTGCKVAVIDKHGNYLDNTVIYVTPPKENISDATKKLAEFVQKYNAYTVAIGNGTASRETEQFIAEFAKKMKNKLKSKNQIEYAIVSEAGASVYSASAAARQEFPNLDLTVRGAISIARRLQDPLAELIKIDPKSIGVGLYQHDVNQTALRDALDEVIEDCVNSVGVDLNTASPQLLEHVSGLNRSIAKKIVTYRQENGSFYSRNQLYEIRGLGEKTFEQCAGFLKVFDGSDPLDATIIHPESYEIVQKILEKIKITPEQLLDSSVSKAIARRLQKVNPNEIAQEFKEKSIDPEKIKYILDQLAKPTLDPRDKLEPPLLRKDILSIEDLKEGMIVKGTVRNVVDFGAFVDIGIKHDGLIHRSEIANRYVRNPSEYLSVGDIVEVMIIGVDRSRNRVQLSLKQVPQPDHS
ncbi:helix-hairpin-helix domain-containing protein [Candidatus Harpocratesius sp.]